MLLLSLLQLLFGNLFVIRIVQVYHARALVNTRVVTKTGTLFVVLGILLTIQCVFYGPELMNLLTANGIFCVLTLAGLERQQRRLVKAEIPLFLDAWILNLRLGLALNSARESALRECSPRLCTLLTPFFKIAPGGHLRRHALLDHGTQTELERLSLEPHLALVRLQNLRQRLRKQAEFRRKSGQAVRQTQLQSLVLLLLLFALSFFTVHHYGWKQCWDLLLAAYFLAGLGVFAMLLLARKWRWKV